VGHGSDPTEPAVPKLIIPNDLKKFVSGEIRPKRLGDEKFGIGDLPEQEIADTHLTAGSNQQIRIRNMTGVKMI
jgi:hypothetical protein